MLFWKPLIKQKLGRFAYMKGIRFVLAIFLLGVLAVFLGPCSTGRLSSMLVEPSHSSIPVGLSQQFTAIGTYSDRGANPNISTQVTWSSSNPAVATIDNTGLATAISPGTVTITASSGGIEGSATLTVTPATLSSISNACRSDTCCGANRAVHSHWHFF
jgi:hypothetical protein